MLKSIMFDMVYMQGKTIFAHIRTIMLALLVLLCVEVTRLFRKTKKSSSKACKK